MIEVFALIAELLLNRECKFIKQVIMSVEFLERPEKHKLAYVYSPATKDGAHLPLVMFCGGYRSDMQGTKATFLEEQCKARGQAFVRFDYSGHGQSEGLFEDGTIGEWYEDALAIFDHINQGGAPVLLVGSSMGAGLLYWLPGHVQV